MIEAFQNFLDKLTILHGKISDQKAIWFPFMFLKPKSQTERIKPVKRLLMTFCFTWYAACFWPIKQILFQNPVDKNEWIIFSLKCLAFFAVWFRLVTSPLWNRRAKMIEEGRA